MIYYCLVELHLGLVALLWMDKELPILLRVVLPDGELDTPSLLRRNFPDAQECSQALIDEMAGKLRELDQSKDVEFSLSRLMLQGWSGFYRRVWLETSRIPRGEVRTYGQVANNISSPRAARAVGTALGKNPFPMIIPCHRVITSQGKLGGYSGGGPEVKRRLLEMEGLLFDGRGRLIGSS